METLEELEGLGNYSYHVLRSWGACCTAMHNRKVPGWKPRAVHDDGSDLRVKQRNPHFQLAVGGNSGDCGDGEGGDSGNGNGESGDGVSGNGYGGSGSGDCGDGASDDGDNGNGGNGNGDCGNGQRRQRRRQR